MEYRIINKIFIGTAIAMIYGCSSELKPTSIKVTDNVRHYYPIMTGEILTLSYEIENTGKNPLIISDIQTTCGCITTSNNRKIIPQGQKSILNFKYNSSKNFGYVEHKILLYGNFDSTNVYKLYFDINVISDTNISKDYEVLYKENVSKKVNKITNKKYYYVDSLTKDR